MTREERIMNTAKKDRDAILIFTESMQGILDGIQEALRKNDIAERDAILEKLQKDLEKMEVPSFRFY
jgi:hypothetical protein